MFNLDNAKTKIESFIQKTDHTINSTHPKNTVTHFHQKLLSHSKMHTDVIAKCSTVCLAKGLRTCTLIITHTFLVLPNNVI